MSQRNSEVALWVFAAAGFAGAARVAWWYWPGAVLHDTTSGTWMALAWDAAHGEFYRPVLAASGYGGTRYMPGFFLALSLLLRGHIDPVWGGAILMQCTVIAAALALYAAQRAIQVPSTLARPCAATLWATMVYQRYLPDLRADYMAASFAMAALAAALVARRTRHRRWLVAASVLCVLGALTKISTIAIAAPLAFAVAWTDGRERWGTAKWFSLGTLALFGASLLAIELASAGRFSENVRATITAGMTRADLWRHGPASLTQELINDPFIGVPFLVAVACLLVAARRRSHSMVHGYFVVVALLTVFILASPGTGANQLVDLQLASTLVIALAVHRAELSSRVAMPLYVGLTIAMAVVSVPVPGIPSMIGTLVGDGPHQRETVTAIQRDFLARTPGYLSTDALVPILGGERPLVMDDFNLDLAVRQGTPAGRDIERRVRAREFDTVVLRQHVFPRDMDSGDPLCEIYGRQRWAEANALERLVFDAYAVRAVRRPYLILKPRPSLPATQSGEIRNGEPRLNTCEQGTS